MTDAHDDDRINLLRSTTTLLDISLSAGQTNMNRHPCNWKTKTVLSATMFIALTGLFIVQQYGFIGRARWPHFIIDESVLIQTSSSRPNSTSSDDAAAAAAAPSEEIKVIALWTPFFTTQDYGFGLGRREPFVRAGCSVDACETTTDRSRLSEADALVFHMRNTQRRDIPTTRLPHQRFVFFMLESPDNTDHDMKQFAGVFNWTMTYRRDSDVIINYFDVRRRLNKTTTSTSTSPRGRRRLVSWLVSNCGTSGHRERYVAELRRHLDVDVYGACGTKCGQQCEQRVFGEHKFYLSFENSVCVDYVTEKLSNALSKDIVPVVYGAAEYTAIAPPNSFVDVRKFASPGHLANYLKALNANDTAYDAYLAWKSEYEVDREVVSRAFCKLCAKLHQRPSTKKVYEDINRWWIAGGNCSHVGVLGWPTY